MTAEIKTSNVKIESPVAKTLHNKFKKHCKKLNVSMAQRVRDLIQQDIKR